MYLENVFSVVGSGVDAWLKLAHPSSQNTAQTVRHAQGDRLKHKDIFSNVK